MIKFALSYIVLHPYIGFMDTARYFSGQFLLATPGMADPRFARSIIALCSHDEHGALGINLGETVEGLGFHEILEQFGIDHSKVANHKIHLGGPVEQQRGFILHSLDMSCTDTLQVGDRWGLSSSVDMMRAIADGKGPEKSTMALGYSGWGEGQLESELTQNGWAVVPGEVDWLFGDENIDKWQMAWNSQGIDVAKLSGQFGSA